MLYVLDIVTPNRVFYLLLVAYRSGPSNGNIYIEVDEEPGEHIP